MKCHDFGNIIIDVRYFTDIKYSSFAKNRIDNNNIMNNDIENE